MDFYIEAQAPGENWEKVASFKHESVRNQCMEFLQSRNEGTTFIARIEKVDEIIPVAKSNIIKAYNDLKPLYPKGSVLLDVIKTLYPKAFK